MSDVWTDEMMLDVLHRVEALGQSYEDAAKAHGVTRSSVGGMIKRVRDAIEAEDRRPLARAERPVQRPENRDGALKPLWWKAGVTARKRRGQEWGKA